MPAAGQGAPGQWSGAPAAGAPAAGGPLGVAAGMACTSDADPHCTFGRCIQGRCGGCASTSDCKPHASCAWTPLGTSCVFGGSSAPAQQAPPGSSWAPAQNPMDRFGSARRACVDKTNALRARTGQRALAQRADAEPCADGQAVAHAQAARAHATFGRCGETAQNECPSWPGAPEAVVASCLDSMYAEGPAGGHHRNLVDPRKSGVACGFTTTADGRLWMVQNLY